MVVFGSARLLRIVVALACLGQMPAVCMAQQVTDPSAAYPPVLNQGDNVRLAPLNPTTGEPSAVNNLGGINSMSTLGNAGSLGGLPLRGQVTAIPKGSTMIVRLDQPVSSTTNRLGDPVSATLENDLFVNNAVAIPAGSIIQGQVSNVSKSGRLGKPGDLDLRFYSARTPDGGVIPLRAHVVTPDDTGMIRGDKVSKVVLKDVGSAVGGTALGTVAGVAAGSLLGSVGTGALFGLGVGGLVGLGYAVLREGKEVVLPSGSRVSLIADQSSTVAGP